MGNHFRMIIKSYPMVEFYCLGRLLFSNWRANYECASIRIIVDVDLENHVSFPYYGPRSICPSLNIVTYTPFHDLFASNFVFMRPLDLII